MILKTFNTILSELVDEFDKLISPMKLSRANYNIVYLLIKSFAKGCEVMNNLVVNLRNKFDPERCEIEDLESIARLVGTSKYAGSATGLEIKVLNTSKELAILEPGTYTYKQDEDSVFVYENPTEDDLAFGASKTQIFMSTKLEPIHITAQENIKVTGVRADGSLIELPDGIIFSCKDNKGLQGVKPEDNLAFRQRILKGTSTATLLNKMQTEINNLPYIYSCRLIFNNSTTPVVEGSTSINPYNLLIVLVGTPDEKVAEIVSSYGVYETMQVDPELYVDYRNDIFIDGYHRIYYMNPEILTYNLKVEYEVDSKVISDLVVQKKIEDALAEYKLTNEYTPLITEREFSNFIMNLGINTLQILNVDLYIEEESPVDYIKVDRTKIARLGKIDFSNIV